MSVRNALRHRSPSTDAVYSTPDRGSLLRNTAAQSTPLILGYIYSFASAPIVVGGLGIRQFGIWALTAGIVQYVGLLDGFGPSLSRFVAANQGNRRVCGQYIFIGLLSVAAAGAIAIATAVAVAGPLSRAVQGISPADMRIVGVSASVLFTTGSLSFVLCAYPIGHCRMVAPNVGIAVGATVNFIASVGSIVSGAGLAGYALANAGAGVVSLLLVTVLVLSAEGPIPIARPTRERVTDCLGYSLKYQTVRMATLVNFQTDKIVIGLSIGPGAAGAYELANRVAVAAREVGVFPMTALLPTLTAEMSRFGVARILPRYGRLTEITATFGFPPLLLTAAIAPILLGAWLSAVPRFGIVVLAALLLAYVVDVSSGVGSVLASAAGDPGIAARAAAGTAVVNVILTASLAPELRMWGVLGGTIVALSGGACVQVLLIQRRFSLPLRAYIEAVMPPLRVGGMLAVPIAFLAYSGIIHGRALQGCAVVVLSLVYVGLYGSWAIRTGRLPQRVQRWVLESLVPRQRAASRLVRARLGTWTR